MNHLVISNFLYFANPLRNPKLIPLDVVFPFYGLFLRYIVIGFYQILKYLEQFLIF